jgi:FlaA1/EpsC-like NDP-sugar epimerase
MSKLVFKGAQILIDLAVLSLAFWIAFLLRFEFDLELRNFKLLFFTWPYVIVLKYMVLSLFGIPNFSWRYIGIKESTRMLTALAVATVILVVIRISFAPVGGYSKFVIIPLGVLGIDFVLAFMGIAGVRVLRRMKAEREERTQLKGPSIEEKRTLLIGAGRAGSGIAREMLQNPHLGMKIVGFVDDDPMKAGILIQGHKVLGDTSSLAKLVKQSGAEQAIITIASASGSSIRRIVTVCEAIPIPVKIVPGIYEILEGRVSLTRIREVTIEDLLGREAVELDLDAIGRFLCEKRVLVTGAGGSIGSELCRQVTKYGPQKLLLLEQAENALFEIHRELLEIAGELEIVPCIADVCDSKRIDELFEKFKPQVIFHAAAHKHVPMMEWNPGEAIKNNVFGTKKVADAAHEHGAEAFVMISTDKAVNPTSIMGASKRVAEIYVQGLSSSSKTTFVAVRFGNVLGSAGSVIPIFKDQIKKGGPVTVTHPEMKRYFMTIPEACQLVMQSATMGNGGEIFVLDMGEPVKIVDLAKDLVRLSGFSEEEMSIEFTGIRPGEKLFEELSTSSEKMEKTRHPSIYIGKIKALSSEEIALGLDELENIQNSASGQQVRTALGRLVSEMYGSDAIG